MTWFSTATGVAFVNAGQPQTVAQLLANFPAGISYVGMYGRVSDLYGLADEVMRCAKIGSSYYWIPQRVIQPLEVTATSGTVNLTPLVTPPVVFLTGNLGASMTVTPATTNVWPGCQFTINSKGLLGIFGINITGLVGGTLPLLAGGSRTVTYVDGVGWQGA